MAPDKKADRKTAPGVAVDVIVEAGDWPRGSSLKRRMARVVSASAEMAGAPIAPGAELAIIFTDDRHIRVLNRRYRRKDAATNVLSFPGARRPGAPHGPLLGDIVLAHETVAREAADLGLAMNDHMTHLVVHGFLHLLGHDHMNDAEAAVMEKLETAILARLGIADPYGGSGGR